MNAGCHAGLQEPDFQTFSEDNAGLSPEYWDGWQVVLHPDNGYWCLEREDSPHRIYVVRKRGEAFVKYYSEGSWKRNKLPELLSDSDNKIISDENFRSRVDWLLANDIVFLYGDSTSVKIQSKNFATQIEKRGDDVVWQEWDECWSR